MLLTIRILIGIGLIAVLISQCRKPWGWPGRLMARAMNRGHSALARWGLGHVTIEPGFRILDIGCGGGRMVQTLSAFGRSRHRRRRGLLQDVRRRVTRDQWGWDRRGPRRGS